MARRGPAAGLKQARTTEEAAQWLRLFEALATATPAVLAQLRLRSTDAAALHRAGSRAAASLRAILAETRHPAALDDVNGVLAAAYAELEQVRGARLARRVFALGDDGFPCSADLEVIAAWSAPLRALREGSLEVPGLSAAKRDVATAVLGHYFAAIAPLDTLAATAAGDSHSSTTAPIDWLVALMRWRRFARACRALGKVLTPAERQRLVEAAGQLQARPVRSRVVDCWTSTGSHRAGGTC